MVQIDFKNAFFGFKFQLFVDDLTSWWLKLLTCNEKYLWSYLGMFDRDKNGTIDFNEFNALWQYVTDWSATFRNYDLDNSGAIDRRELIIGESEMKLPNFWSK